MNEPAITPGVVDPRFHGIERLYGVGAVARLARSRVAVVGIGGVGAWASRIGIAASSHNRRGRVWGDPNQTMPTGQPSRRRKL